MLEPIAITINQTAAFISCSRSKVYQLIKMQEIQTKKVGTKTLVVVSSVKEFIAGNDQKVS